MDRLLIVDDEFPILDWLFDLFAGQPELDVYRAHTGRRALEILERTRIDVILSDIRMPGMDGFELADAVRRNWPESRIIFLTGYDSFDYIYRASREEYADYLLKTEEDAEILACVRRAFAAIREERRQQSLEAEITDSRRLMHDSFERQELLDALDALAPENVPFPLNPDRNTLPVLGGLAAGLPQGGLERARQAQRLRQISAGIFPKRLQFVIIDWQEWFLWLFQSDEPAPDVYVRESLEALADAAERALGQTLRFRLYGQPERWDRLLPTLRWMAALPSREEAAVYRIVTPGEREKSGREFNWTRTLQSVLTDLAGRLDRHDVPGVRELLGQLDALAAPVQSPPQAEYYELCQCVSLMYLQHITRYRLEETLPESVSLRPLRDLAHFPLWEEAARYLDALTAALDEGMRRQKTHGTQELVERIRRYVAGHLSAGLSLAEISEEFHYNPAYISRVFRQISGESLSDCINRCRIRAAKALLLETEEPVTVIAARTGFDSANYFSTVFKRSVGMTPLEFRRDG